MTWLPVGLAAGVLALALSRGSVFAPLRARLTGWPGELASCWLCQSAWWAAGLTALEGAGGLHPVVAWAAAWGAGALLAATVDRLAGG